MGKALSAQLRLTPLLVDGQSVKPLAEVEGALLVVEVLHLPHPQLLGLLHVGGLG